VAQPNVAQPASAVFAGTWHSRSRPCLRRQPLVWLFHFGLRPKRSRGRLCYSAPRTGAARAL